MISIELIDMRFYAHHGCFAEEREIGTHFCVDVSIEAPESCRAVVSDRLEDTLNYQDIYKVVAMEMNHSSFLLEHIAGRIIKQLKKRFPTTGIIRVCISKLNPPIGGEVGASRVVLTSEECL